MMKRGDIYIHTYLYIYIHLKIYIHTSICIHTWYWTDTCTMTNTLSCVLVSHATSSCVMRRLTLHRF